MAAVRMQFFWRQKQGGVGAVSVTDSDGRFFLFAAIFRCPCAVHTLPVDSEAQVHWLARSLGEAGALHHV